MTLFYSSSKHGFYDSEIHGSNVPADAVVITSAAHAALMNGQIAGKVIAADAKGFPILTDAAQPSLADQALAANAVIIAQIVAIEQDLQPRAMRDAALYNDNTRLQDIDKQIKALRAQLK